MTKKTESMKFEQQMDDLEKIVDAMEQGSLSLDDSLKSFEKGVKLAQSCMKTLEQAELKVKKLDNTPSSTENTSEHNDH